MPWWFYFLLTILFLCLLILLAMFIPLRIFIRYLRKNNNVQVAVSLKVGCWSYRVRPASGKDTSEKMIRQPAAVFGRLKPYLKKMSWRHFKLDLAYGTGDAAITGMLVGLGWALGSFTMALLNSQTRLATVPRISITPLFNQFRLEVLWEGEVSMSAMGWLRLWLATKKIGGNNHGKSPN